MRRLLSLILAILISGVAFGQIQPINVSKVLDKSKESKTNTTQSNTQMDRVQRDNNTIHFANPDKKITGEFSLYNPDYISGDTTIFYFNFTFESPDIEWCDGISITFPTGMTPIEDSTSSTIGSGFYVANLVTPISGNTVVWGQVSTPSGYGDILPGSYDFQVEVAIDANTTGRQSIVCYAMGDGLGAAPHTINNTLIVSDSIWGFAWNVNDPDSIIPRGPVKVSLATGDIVPIGSYTGTDFMLGADFIKGDWYASSYNGKSLVKINTTTGNLTTIGNLGLVMNGLAYDATTDKLYGCAYDGLANSILYEINYYTGACKKIGTICPGNMIGLAANSHGNIYGINITNNSLYKINKTTGAGTVVGALGHDINYDQDIAFDKDNDYLYCTLYTEGLLGVIDTLTGAVTVYDTTSCELTGLAFPYAYILNENDIAIIDIDLPKSGCDVPANNSIIVTLKNVGLNELSNIPVNISINNDTLFTDTVAGPIASGTTLDHAFSQNFDFSADSVYNITVYTSLSSVENHINDTMREVVNNYAPDTIPKTINFDNSSLHDSFTIIDNNGDDNTLFYVNAHSYAHSGNYALAYIHNDTISADDYFFSSCINLSDEKFYKLSLWYRVADSTYPGSFEVYLASSPSVDDTIGSPIISVSNATNTTYAEAIAKKVTVGSNGTYYIAIRSTSDTDMSALIIDDITIDTMKYNDIAIIDIDLPASGCDVSGDSITITLKNVGAYDLSNIPVKILINNDTITDTVTSTIAFDSTLVYPFPHSFNFSADGDYNITAYASLSSDENHNNDTMRGVVQNYASATVPTTINFDDISLHDRYTIVDNNSDGITMFYLNNPLYARSGNYALAYNDSTASSVNDYFFSSCIDLSSEQIYKLSLWYRVKSSSYPVSFEVYLASAPSVDDIFGSTIISVSNATNENYKEATKNHVTVANDDSYYIAIRATNYIDTSVLIIDDITIDFSNDIKENEINFNIYPNPANDFIYIDLINSYSDDIMFRLFDVLGNEIIETKLNENNKIDIAYLNNGIYIYQIIYNNKKIINGKLLKY